MMICFSTPFDATAVDFFGEAVASIALEATVIEKHFTLSRADGGVIVFFSWNRRK